MSEARFPVRTVALSREVLVLSLWSPKSHVQLPRFLAQALPQTPFMSGVLGARTTLALVRWCVWGGALYLELLP